ncbi:MAG: DUF3810 domain-containing protein [Lachnospiraceae bacterium]|jgi:hypothetical protein|nr:DUF3810 domain-containing protein [Lachnospiraceae bacterium]MCI1726285.1 DUF3810 domain-containing protein [Lachnospiraceae bacterium]
MSKVYTAAAFAAAAVVLRLLCGVSGFAERFTQIMNPIAVNTLGRLSGFLPFSLAEMLIYLLILLLVVWIVRSIVKGVRRTGAGKYMLNRGAVLLLIAAVLFFLYEANQDVPFSQPSFSERYGLSSGSYSTENLAATGRMLIQNINARAGSVSRDENEIMTVSGNLKERIRTAMENEAKIYPILSGYYPETKDVFNSWALSYLGITGVFSAATMEANVNVDMTAYNIPFTMCHELSHLHGSMPEDECNFIAYLACRDSSDADISYSGYLTGWVYVGNELYARDKSLWESAAGQLDQRANLDLEANSKYWDARKGKARETADSLNDSYLKSQGESEGILSYDKAVDLIVTEYLKNGS